MSNAFQPLPLTAQLHHLVNCPMAACRVTTTASDLQSPHLLIQRCAELPSHLKICRPWTNTTWRSPLHIGRPKRSRPLALNAIRSSCTQLGAALHTLLTDDWPKDLSVHRHRCPVYRPPPRNTAAVTIPTISVRLRPTPIPSTSFQLRAVRRLPRIGRILSTQLA